jgi:hypothetical protein
VKEAEDIGNTRMHYLARLEQRNVGVHLDSEEDLLEMGMDGK